MTYSIVYCSKTGNTAKLAGAARACLPAGEITYCGAPAAAGAEAGLVLAGFWTDKGGCGEEMAAFLGGLRGRRVFLFGTAGFGGAQAYFDQILGRAAQNLDPSNTLVGSYMCQGAMPDSVRARYEAMGTTDPERARDMLENFDRALPHPDAADLDALKQAVRALAEKMAH